MSQNTSTASLFRKLIPSIITTGLVAGTMDGLAAIINFSINGGKNPEIIFKYIASGAIGENAFPVEQGVRYWELCFIILLLFAGQFFSFGFTRKLKGWRKINCLPLFSMAYLCG